MGIKVKIIQYVGLGAALLVSNYAEGYMIIGHLDPSG